MWRASAGRPPVLRDLPGGRAGPERTTQERSPERLREDDVHRAGGPRAKRRQGGQGTLFFLLLTVPFSLREKRPMEKEGMVIFVSDSPVFVAQKKTQGRAKGGKVFLSDIPVCVAQKNTQGGQGIVVSDSPVCVAKKKKTQGGQSCFF